MEKESKIIIIIPCFNEAKRFSQLNWEKEFEIFKEFYFLFINDGSKDKTIDFLENFSNNYPNVFFLELFNNVGKAEAIRQGVLQFNSIQYDYVAYLDADLATSVSELKRISEYITNTKRLEFVMGFRIKLIGNQVKRTLFRHYLGRIFARLVSQFILKFPIYDTQCGAKIMTSNLALQLFEVGFITKWLFDVELLLRFKNINPNLEQKTKETPLETWEEKGGSKIKFKEFIGFPFQLLKLYTKYA